MKGFLLSIMIVVLFTLLGCQHNTIPAGSLDTKADLEGFVEPEPAEWVKYSKPIREYMYYRTQAVVHNNLNLLWTQYPDLEDHYDLDKGINIERNEVESLNQGFNLLDANYNIEQYERIKVKTFSEDEVVVLVHGSIHYLRDDFEESGGEYLIKIFLMQEDNDWTVQKTDEYTLPEYKEWLKGTNDR